MFLSKLKFPALAFLLAFAGINYEFLISQGISANFGGTFIQYMLTFALFTFALGLGALVFQKITTEKITLRLLGVLQIILSAFAFLLPVYFQWTDPWTHASGGRFVWVGLSYFPAILFGLATGLEIPFLMSVAKKQAIAVLAFDFLGMFVGTVLFPTVMLFKFGLFHATDICALLNLVIGIYLFFIGPQSAVFSEDPTAEPEMSAGRRRLYMLLAFILAFCSFSYQAILTKFIISIIGDEFQSQVYMIGFFLLGLGVGSLWFEIKKVKDALGTWIKVEFLLSSLAALLPVLLLLFASYFELLQRDFVNSKQEILGLPLLPLYFGVFPLAVGILTGMELPLLFYHLKMQGSEKFSIRLVAMNYFGSLCAGVLTTLILLPLFGSVKMFTIVSLLNIVAVYLLIMQGPPQKRLLKMIIPFVALVFCSIGLVLQDPLQSTFLKIHYEDLMMSDLSIKSFKNLEKVLDQVGSVFRIESKYQNIDLVLAQDTKLEGENHYFALYLNHHPQFSAANWKAYHESLSYGTFNLAKKVPEKVLILGAGDGLLVHELLAFTEVKKITLVELDPKMIELANSFASITLLNEYALKNPKVEIVIQDAYQYVKTLALAAGNDASGKFTDKTTDKFDAIFIDFPYPNSFDLLRLYSVEFYKNVFDSLNAGGFAVLDAPLFHRVDIRDPQDERRYSILQATLASAGFTKPFAFGPFDPFLFVTKDNREVAFDYAALPSAITDRGFVNLLKISLLEEVRSAPELVNSIYFPKWLN